MMKETTIKMPSVSVLILALAYQQSEGKKMFQQKHYSDDLRLMMGPMKRISSDSATPQQQQQQPWYRATKER